MLKDDDTRVADELLAKAVLRLDSRAVGLIFGLLAAVGLFVATNWLVLRGGPNVGQHLGLLREYFPGYSVTFVGSLIGAAYALAAGFAAGWLTARVYNAVASAREERAP